MKLMYCPNIQCKSDFSEVRQLASETWSIGTYIIAATKPCCPLCGVDLTPRAPTVIQDYNMIQFLHTLV